MILAGAIGLRGAAVRAPKAREARRYRDAVAAEV